MTKRIKDLRVAIIHDWFWSMKGAEKCAEALGELFPQADIYALFGDRSRMSSKLKKHKMIFSILQKLPFIKHIYRYTYILWPLLIEQFDLSGYDLVVSSSSSVAKGVVTDYKTVHICYMHSPMRYAWDQTFDYFNPENFSLWKRIVIPFFLNYLRIWDVVSTDRIDFLIANSKFTSKRIEKYYQRKPDAVVYPPLGIEEVKINKKKEDYFVASPFDPNKGGRLIVEAAMLYGFKLKLYGTGPLFKELKKKARKYKNIEFLGWVSDAFRWELISRAKGCIYAGVEDLGIIALEAMACGVPVVAYKAGGVVETVKEGKTGVFFNDQKASALYEAILKLETLKMDQVKMRNHVKKFAKDKYMKQMSKLIKAASKDFLIE